MQRSSVSALLVLAIGCTSTAKPASDGDPWRECTGSHGAKLSCQSVAARAVFASRYDRERACFLPRVQPETLCAVPTYCPGGVGELACFVSAGNAYAVYILYGEELADSGWHHDSSALLTSTLTAAEKPLCDELWQTLHGGEGVDAGSVLVDSSSGASAEVSPACPE